MCSCCARNRCAPDGLRANVARVTGPKANAAKTLKAIALDGAAVAVVVVAVAGAKVMVDQENRRPAINPTSSPRWSRTYGDA